MLQPSKLVVCAWDGDYRWSVVKMGWGEGFIKCITTTYCKVFVI